MHRRISLVLLACAGLVFLASSARADVAIFADSFDCGLERWACVNLECFQCCPNPKGGNKIRGVVYAPNGTLPLPGVKVYVPNAEISPFEDGVACRRCGEPLSGDPITEATSGADGSFLIEVAPATTDVPLVIQSGRWRRQITIPSVAQCDVTDLTADQTRLPKNRGEGDIPKIALVTGGSDSIECLLRKSGLDTAEFSNTGDARVHLFAGTGGTDAIDGVGAMSAATSLWGSSATLAQYDNVLLGCEGSQDTGNKPAPALANVSGYVDAGGRVYAGHWQNYWLQAAPTDMSTIGTWGSFATLGTLEVDVDQESSLGGELAAWLVETGASSTLGKLTLTDARHTLQTISSEATRWLWKETTANSVPTVQLFSFSTPLEDPPTERCGRVVFTDMHPNGGDSSNSSFSFPTGGCTSPVISLSPSEKALLYALFHLERCVGDSSE